MITLGRAYSVPEWVTEGLCALGHSHTLIDASLFDTLGHLTALRIYQIRERKEFPEARSNEDNGTFSSEYQGVEEDVIRVFCDELEGLRKGFEEHDIPRFSTLTRSLFCTSDTLLSCHTFPRCESVSSSLSDRDHFLYSN